MSKVQEITVADTKFKYGFRITPGTSHLAQWEFSKEINKVVSWLVTNISEYDEKRWNTHISLSFNINPITPKFAYIDAYFLYQEDAVAFKLKWA